MITIYDIAKEAGVAASTVSRVINNKPGIKDETRKRIQELLVKYHYSPNETARGLVKRASGIIGILMADIRVSHHIDSAYIIEQEMAGQGYCCITMSAGAGEEEKAEHIRILKQRRVEGAILMGSVFETPQVRKSIQEYLSNIPIILANGYLDLPNVYGILIDEQSGIEQCVSLLVQKGRRKLAFVKDSESPSNTNKLRGFTDAMNRLGWKKDELWLYESTGQTVSDGYEITRRIVGDHPEVEGVIYSIDLLAAGGIRAFYDMGIRVPDQTAVIGVDNTVYGEICMPRLTTLDNQLHGLSVTAARNLTDALSGKAVSRKVMLFSEIIEREST